MQAEAGGEEGDSPTAPHLRCLYCHALYPLAHHPGGHAAGALGCAAPLPRACFACGQPAPPAAFSARQLARLEAGEPARCARCAAAGGAAPAARHEPPPPPPTLDQQLEEAVAGADEAGVAALLAQGADANAPRQRGVSLGGRWRGLFSAAGAPLPEADAEDAQPTTPLKLAAFRAADCALGRHAPGARGQAAAAARRPGAARAAPHGAQAWRL
jgi:hypothetical protein